jgi:hypothetical protein
VADVPVEGILAKTNMKTLLTGFVVAAKHPGELAVKRHNRGIEDAVGARDRITRDNWILTVAPDGRLAILRFAFPGNVGDDEVGMHFDSFRQRFSSEKVVSAVVMDFYGAASIFLKIGGTFINCNQFGSYC